MTTQDQEQQNAQVDHADEIDIGQLIGLLIDRWLMIAGVTALFLISGVYYALSAVSIKKRHIRTENKEANKK